MSKKLLTDVLPLRLTIDESDAGGKVLARGEFARADKPTANNRIYPLKIWESNIRQLQKDIRARKVFGECDHPESGRTSLKRVSHIITDLKVNEDGLIIGEAEIVDTDDGRNLKALIKAGAAVGVSSRGFGSVIQKEGYDVVQEDFNLMTFDFVIDPAMGSAYPEFESATPSVESKEQPKTDAVVESESPKTLKESVERDIEAMADHIAHMILASDIASAVEESGHDVSFSQTDIMDSVPDLVLSLDLSFEDMKKRLILDQGLEDIAKMAADMMTDEDIDDEELAGEIAHKLMGSGGGSGDPAFKEILKEIPLRDAAGMGMAASMEVIDALNQKFGDQEEEEKEESIEQQDKPEVNEAAMDKNKAIEDLEKEYGPMENWTEGVFDDFDFESAFDAKHIFGDSKKIKLKINQLFKKFKSAKEFDDALEKTNALDVPIVGFSDEEIFPSLKKDEQAYFSNSWPVSPDEGGAYGIWPFDIDKVLGVQTVKENTEKSFDSESIRMPSCAELWAAEDAEKKVKQLESIIKQLSFALFLEKNLHNHPQKKEIIESLNFDEYEDLNQLNDKIAEQIQESKLVKSKIVAERKELKTSIKALAEAKDSIVQENLILKEKVASLEKEKAYAESVAHAAAITAYTESKISGNPAAHKIRSVAQKMKLTSKEQVDALIESQSSISKTFQEIRESIKNKKDEGCGVPANLVEEALKNAKTDSVIEDISLNESRFKILAGI